MRLAGPASAPPAGASTQAASRHPPAPPRPTRISHDGNGLPDAGGPRGRPLPSLSGHERQREAPACWPATLPPRRGAPGDDRAGCVRRRQARTRGLPGPPDQEHPAVDRHPPRPLVPSGPRVAPTSRAGGRARRRRRERPPRRPTHAGPSRTRRRARPSRSRRRRPPVRCRPSCRPGCPCRPWTGRSSTTPTSTTPPPRLRWSPSRRRSTPHRARTRPSTGARASPRR